MSLAERYKRALVFKSRDVEEPIDMVLHRPIAALVTAFLLLTPLRPNHVTLSSLIVGWMGSLALALVVFADAPNFTYALSGVLLFFSVVLDCADGQLARARGGGTRAGRILDGVVDMLVLLPAWFILGIDAYARHGSYILYVGIVAGLTSWFRIIAYDKFKSVYLARTQPSAADGTETLEELEEEYRAARGLDFLLLFIYVRIYWPIQSRFSSASQEGYEVTEATAAEYRRQHSATMRLVSFMGLGSHFFLIYLAVACMSFHAYSTSVAQIFLALVGNFYFFVVLWRARSMT